MIQRTKWIFVVVMLALFAYNTAHAERNWRWILTNVYWNLSGGQVCEFREIGGHRIAKIVRKRGYGCPNKSMNPYNEP